MILVFCFSCCKYVLDARWLSVGDSKTTTSQLLLLSDNKGRVLLLASYTFKQSAHIAEFEVAICQVINT